MAAQPAAVLALTNTVVKVGAGPCKLKSIQFHNDAAALTFLQLFDAAEASQVTLGTTPASTIFSALNGRELSLSDLDMTFGKGLCMAATTEAGNSTAPSAAQDVGLGIEPAG